MTGTRFDQSARGVSPVIGVVLMVAITVILAGTAAAFFFQVDQQAVDAPQAGFSFEYDETGSSDRLEMSHQSGDALDSDDVYLRISDASRATGDPNGEYAFYELSGISSGDEIRAGTKAVVRDRPQLDGNGDLDLTGATVRILWKSPAEKKTIILDSWDD